ncbi:MAG: hypothetical protein J5902_02845 [Paludibacteraceae bacterium]|nr:hypothetical protein [Paludibacteraceae bacterium]
MRQQNIIYGLIALALSISLLLVSCGVKNGYVVGEYGKYPLSGEIIAAKANDSVQAVKGTMGMLWQGDSLRITLNQGRQLLRAKTGKDTLYLYEAPRGAESDLQAQAINDTTRQYTFYIPTRELFIIKYNDSLVYPVMPTTEPCEYPLEIKSMGIKNLNRYYELRQQSLELQQKTGLWGGAFNAEYEPMERQEGTYLFNAGSYEYGSDCECVTDSNKILILNIDGSWQLFENEKLTNCGVMRKFKLPKTFEAFSYKGKIVYFQDTTAITFLSYTERKKRREKNIPWNPNEYNLTGKVNSSECSMFTFFPCTRDSLMNYFYDSYDESYKRNVLMLEGTSCGWIQQCVRLPNATVSLHRKEQHGVPDGR